LRVIVKLLPVLFAALISSAAPVHSADVFSGSGVVIGTNGEVLTNAHVIENCTESRELLASGQGHRCQLGDCLNIEVERVEE
jgi:S1-C subfamily serine protease